MSFGSKFGVILRSCSYCFLLFFRGAIFMDFGLHFGLILGSFFVCFRGCFFICFLGCVFGAKKGHDGSSRSDFGTPGEGKGEG